MTASGPLLFMKLKYVITHKTNAHIILSDTLKRHYQKYELEYLSKLRSTFVIKVSLKEQTS